MADENTENTENHDDENVKEETSLANLQKMMSDLQEQLNKASDDAKKWKHYSRKNESSAKEKEETISELTERITALEEENKSARELAEKAQRDKKLTDLIRDKGLPEDSIGLFSEVSNENLESFADSLAKISNTNKEAQAQNENSVFSFITTQKDSKNLSSSPFSNVAAGLDN